MTDQKTSIVFLRIGHDPMGGADKMLLRLLKRLDNELFCVEVVSQQRDELSKKATKLGIKTQIIPFPGILDSYSGELLTLPLYKKMVAGVRLLQYNVVFKKSIEKPDILWCSGARTLFTVLPYINTNDMAVILNIGLMSKSEGFMKHINRITMGNADHIFIESAAQAKKQLTENQYNKYSEKFTVFHKGIDTQKFEPQKFKQKNQPLRVGTAASINPRKGLEHFIDAASIVIEKYPEVEFTIAGEPARKKDEEYKDTLKKRIHERSIEDNIDFLGWVDDVPQYLSTLDIFVLPSYNEGIPGSIREALSMEVPCIATNVGGIPDVVIPEQTGFLVEIEDSDQIAEYVIRLIENPIERSEIGTQGREYIEDQFSIDSYIENYVSFLKSI